jgi:hypothetical protein
MFCNTGMYLRQIAIRVQNMIKLSMMLRKINYMI